jgi:hypothetical protein
VPLAGWKQGAVGAINGRTEVSILDNQIPPQPIARFRLGMSGTTATYSGNDAAICTVGDAVANYTTGEWLSAAGPVYKYGNTTDYYGDYGGGILSPDIARHSLTMIGQGNGTVFFSMAGTEEELAGLTSAPALAGSNPLNPTWVEIRITGSGSSQEGNGSIRIYDANWGGGLYWGTL